MNAPREVATKPDSLDGLTGLRFLAAAHVVLYHFAAPALPAGTPGWARNVIAHGYVGVSFFYLLSGFILTYNYAEPDGAGATLRGTPKRFLLRRVSRIYPLYLFAWLLTAPFVLAHRLSAAEPWTVRAGKLAVAAATSLGLVQAWLPGANAWWNPPSWSISVEAFFYLAFPVLLPRLLSSPASRRRKLLLAYLAALAAPAAFAAWGGARAGAETLLDVVKYDPLLHLPAFAFGMLLADVYASPARERLRRWRAPLAAGGVALVLAFIVRPLDWTYPLIHDGLLAPGFGAVILAVAVGLPAARLFSTRAFVLLGEASYGVYILQAPLGLAWRRFAPALRPSWDFAAFFAFLCLFSIAAYECIERPAQRWLRRAWSL